MSGTEWRRRKLKQWPGRMTAIQEVDVADMNGSVSSVIGFRRSLLLFRRLDIADYRAATVPGKNRAEENSHPQPPGQEH
jgi:hypothetical protein